MSTISSDNPHGFQYPLYATLTHCSMLADPPPATADRLFVLDRQILYSETQGVKRTYFCAVTACPDGQTVQHDDDMTFEESELTTWADYLDARKDYLERVARNITIGHAHD